MAGRYGYAAHNNINHMQGERKQRISLSHDDFPELYPSAAQKLAQMHANMDRQDALRQASKQAEQDRKASAKAKAEAKKATNNLKKQQRERYGFNQNSKPEAFRKETMFGKMFRKLRRKRSPKEMRNTGEIIQKAIKASKRDERRRRERENRRQASLTPATKRGLCVGTSGKLVSKFIETLFIFFATVFLLLDGATVFIKADVGNGCPVLLRCSAIVAPIAPTV